MLPESLDRFEFPHGAAWAAPDSPDATAGVR
jgi:hypothetical protein